MSKESAEFMQHVEAVLNAPDPNQEPLAMWLRRAIEKYRLAEDALGLRRLERDEAAALVKDAGAKARARGWRWHPCFVHSRPSIRCGSCRYASAKGDEGVSCDGLEQWGYTFGVTLRVGDDTLYSD